MDLATGTLERLNPPCHDKLFVRVFRGGEMLFHDATIQKNISPPNGEE
jgi:hypothetical protein